MSAVGSIAADKPLPNGSEIGRGGGALGEGREKELSSKAQLTKLLRDTLDYETRRLKELKDAGDEKRLKERTTKYVAYLFKRRRSIEPSCVASVATAFAELEREGILTDEHRPQVQEIYCQMSKTLESHDRVVQIMAGLALIVLPAISAYSLLYMSLSTPASPLIASSVAFVIFTMLLRRFYHDLPEVFLDLPFVRALLPSDRTRVVLNDHIRFSGKDLFAKHQLELSVPCRAQLQLSSSRHVEVDFFSAKEYSSFLSATSMPLAPRVCSKNPLSSEDCTQLSGTMDLPAGTYYLVCRPPSQPLLSRPYTAEDRWLVCVKLSMSAAVLGKLPATARSASANVVSKHAKSAHQSSTGQDCIGR